MDNIETLLAAVAQTQGFDDDEPVVSTGPELGLENSESSSVIRGDFSGSQVSGDARPSAVVDTPPLAATPTFPAAGEAISAGEKRKRGRPPKGQLGAKPPPPKRVKLEDEEEDVCFICFDGGSLVLCDRKGCPKAYHPSCIKRDEAFFKSKAKWNCGWHICSGCRKASHYMCYTCTYSLCKGCTRDADYVCVRGNKGFCSTCMKTIMLIENKDQANNESVKVDFDDKLSWEYLFKVYWVILKEKLSLTLTELTQAKRPRNSVATIASRPQLTNGFHHTAVDGKVSMSNRSSEQLELNKPHVDISLLQNNESIEKQNGVKSENGPHHNTDIVKSNMVKATNEPTTDKATSETAIKEADVKPHTGNDQDNSSIAKDAEKPCICKSTTKSDKPEVDSCTEWATQDLLEFVAHMKNGDTSAISQFDVQQLLLEYIKRNNLRDPRRKSQIICDPRLKNLFGKSRVGHIEMLKLLEFHFLIKENSQSSFIPAGFVSSVASDMEVDGSTCELPMQTNSRKRKTRKKIVDRASQNNLNEYAAIDVHNINLIYLRQNLMENLIGDQETFGNKVIGSIVRIRIPSADQKQDVHRLVQVVGTSKVAEPYKIGEKTVDIMLEVLNLDKKEVVSVDAISNQDFTEDECRRLRQCIRCGLVKRFTVGEVQNKAMTLQPVKVNDWLEAEILRLNHLRDRASENGRKKELREYVAKLQLLKSPEERQRRISEVPEIHADPKMSPDYESEDAGNIGNTKKDKYVKSSQSDVPRNGRNSISPNKKVKEERSMLPHSRTTEKTNASGSHNSTISSPSTNHIETEKLWHYRDPNGKIQGAFSMMQLRKWNTTGLFPVDMRIWTNHEQYDSVLLTDALKGKFHGPSESSHKPSQENEATKEIKISEVKNNKESKQTETAPLPNNESVLPESKTESVLPESKTECVLPESKTESVLPESNTGIPKADESGTPSWPQCWDLLKDSDNNNNDNSSAEDVQDRNLLPSSNLGQTDELKNPSQNGEKNSAEPSTELQNQPNSQENRAAEENLRSLDIDLSSNLVDDDVKRCSEIESGPILEPLLKSPDVPNLLSTPKTTESDHPISSDIPMENSIILELLPRSNHEDVQTTETKQQQQPEFLNFNMPNSGPSWNMPGVQIPEVSEEWGGYSPATASKPPIQEWDPSSSKPLQVDINHSSPPHPAQNHIANWLSIINEPIEFDALGEESVSDLLAEVDAMESQGALPSPTSAMKFARELIEDCKDECFSSIEEFRSSTSDPRKSDALSSTDEIQQLTSESSAPYKPIDVFDSLKRSSVHSSASSEGETNAPVYSSEFHPPENVGPASGSESADPAWGSVQGNINLVTVQGNVNLVLGGPGQGMTNLGWGSNPGTGWVNPSINRSPINGSLPWDGNQRKYGGERYTSPREWGYQGRPPWGRQPYGGGGYNRPKGQRVCKFYESGHCKKGAFCDYLHP